MNNAIATGICQERIIMYQYQQQKARKNVMNVGVGRGHEMMLGKRLRSTRGRLR
jgi:hypothetical protein